MAAWAVLATVSAVPFTAAADRGQVSRRPRVESIGIEDASLTWQSCRLLGNARTSREHDAPHRNGQRQGRHLGHTYVRGV